MIKEYFAGMEKRNKIILIAVISLFMNIAYGIGNAVIGFINHSFWFLTASAYYIILSIMRFALIISDKRNNSEDNETGIFVKRFSGAMLLGLSAVLTGTVILAVKNDIGAKYHEIVMITIATYTFTKLVLAIINLCKCKAFSSPVIRALRNISVSDAAVSVFSLQRSMLVSFGEMKQSDIRLFNILTGAAVCIVVFILGINLLRKENENGKIKIRKSK